MTDVTNLLALKLERRRCVFTKYVMIALDHQGYGPMIRLDLVLGHGDKKLQERERERESLLMKLQREVEAPKATALV